MSPETPSANQLQATAYERLSSYFSLHQDKIIEIEILPPAIHPPDGMLMEDGFNLGIPKKILALAYIEARRQFLKFQSATDETSYSLALLATKTMLLFDPEHLTAANYRKRNLVRLKTHPSQETQAMYLDSIRREFIFLNSILMSPLHRQSKSPTLWYHRLWLLNLINPDIVKLWYREASVFWCTEIDAVCKSGEQHPKNYYAWQYARRLIERIKEQELVCEIASRTKDWCCKHPSDISGWAFLVHVLAEANPQSHAESLIREVLQYALNLKSEHESVWVFLRIILAQNLLRENVRVELCMVLCDYRKNITSAPILLERITQTLEWIHKYNKHTYPSGQQLSG